MIINKAVSIHVCQGEREFTKDNKSLGMFEPDIPADSKRCSKIEVTFDIDANGVLNVSTKIKEQVKRIKLQSGSSRIKDDEIAKMVTETETNKETDAKKNFN